jgi:hypothetical protein
VTLAFLLGIVFGDTRDIRKLGALAVIIFGGRWMYFQERTGEKSNTPTMRLGSGMPKGLGIQAILGPASRFFISNQVVDADDQYGLVTVSRRYATFPSVVEVNSINGGDNVDSVGRKTHLENDAWSGKVLNGQVQEGCPEFIQSVPYFLGIIWIRFDPDIEIFGESGRAVDRKSITADDEEFSVRGVQGGKQISEVGIHTHWGESK